MPANPKYNYCLNCETPYPKQRTESKEVFCVECGQSSKANSMSIIALIKDAFSNIFNLDGRLFHTIRDIIHPSKLTKTYIAGRKKYYVNPARLFIFTLIIFISLALSVSNISETSNGEVILVERTQNSKLLDNFNIITDTLTPSIDEAARDSIRARLFPNVKKVREDTIANKEFSIFHTSTNRDYINGNGITYHDAMHLTTAELFKKYEIEGFRNKLSISQFIKKSKNPSGMVEYVIKNMVWALFISSLLISLIIGLLYVRSDYHLLEHGVLALNSHSFLFFYLSIFLVILKIINLIYPFYYSFSIYKGWPAAIVIISILVLQHLTLKKYYGQGFLKTIIKQLIIYISYLFIFAISGTLVGLVSALSY